MAKLIRYGSYLRELAHQQRWPGFRAARESPRWLRLLSEPGGAILSLAAVIVLFQLVVLREVPAAGLRAAAGLAALIAGIALLREGLRTGLAPLCRAFARALVARSRLAAALTAAFAFGLILPFAEPMTAALQAAGSNSRSDPYLHALLIQQPGTLLLVAALGAGVGAALGLYRILRGWSLRPLIVAALVPALGLTGHLLFDPELSNVPALAWDCGALVAGPIAGVLLLAFGDGAAGTHRLPLPGFGLVALCGIVPVLGVLVYAMLLAETTGIEAVLAAPTEAATSPPASPWPEIRSALLAVVPLAVVLFASLRWLMKQGVDHAAAIAVGLLFSLVGLVLINLGVTHGLAVLADTTANGLGTLLDPASAWPLPVAVVLAALLAGVLVRTAARAEPALGFFAELADARTHGVLRRARLMRTIAMGAGIGAFLGVVRTAADLQIGWLLIGGGLIALVLAATSGEDTAAAAWDGAGMMSGPITLPLLVAMGPVLQGPAGFGLPALCALGAALAVLVMGVLARLSHARRALLRHSGFSTP